MRSTILASCALLPIQPWFERTREHQLVEVHSLYLTQWCLTLGVFTPHLPKAVLLTLPSDHALWIGAEVHFED